MQPEQFRIILVGTTHPGNIGAAARAMKNMGLKQLYLVAPKIFPHSEATVRAAGADDILEHAVVVDTLSAALEGVHLVIGTSARLRGIDVAMLTPEALVTLLKERSAEQKVAIVFGRESSGLTNDELHLCQYRLHFPTAKNFSSLNLAAAVLLTAYELRKAFGEEEPAPELPDKLKGKRARNEMLATADELESFYQHLFSFIAAINFAPTKSERKLLLRLRRLFNRAKLRRVEINILRGLFKAAQRIDVVASENNSVNVALKTGVEQNS